ncbi:MAG: 50S ribosomal protein L21 [Planctomycetota bacterium]|jgi:large subunit ribosomal protein L21|nr:50S ribosomal protein L21 [Planctomycetota bacterium]
MARRAVIRTGGKQALVAEGDVFEVELLEAEPGGEVRFDDVLMLVDGADSRIGAPGLEGVSVSAKVLEQTRGKKVRTVFFRRRKDSMSTKGHRQNYHRVKITGIKVD